MHGHARACICDDYRMTATLSLCRLVHLRSQVTAECRLTSARRPKRRYTLPAAQCPPPPHPKHAPHACMRACTSPPPALPPTPLHCHRPAPRRARAAPYTHSLYGWYGMRKCSLSNCCRCSPLLVSLNIIRTCYAGDCDIAPINGHIWLLFMATNSSVRMWVQGPTKVSAFKDLGPDCSCQVLEQHPDEAADKVFGAHLLLPLFLRALFLLSNSCPMVHACLAAGARQGHGEAE